MTENVFIGKKNQFLTALSQVSSYKQKFYLFMTNEETKELVDYQTLVLEMNLNGDSIFAVVAREKLSLDSDQLLILDGSQSFDQREALNTKLQYRWTLLNSD